VSCGQGATNQKTQEASNVNYTQNKKFASERNNAEGIAKPEEWTAKIAKSNGFAAVIL